MKKLLVVVAVLIVLLIAGAPAYAAEDEWIISDVNGLSYGFFYNTNSLQVTTLWINNETRHHVAVHARRPGFDDYIIDSPAYSGYQELTQINFKLRRKPLSDPDDPGSLSYQENQSVGCDFID